MPPPRKILLARPHAFIVSEIRTFLEHAGYAPEKADSVADIESSRHGALAGAIVSTAVVSSIGASAEEVFAALRRKYPRLPVLFAGLVDFAKMQDLVRRIVAPLHADAQILPMAPATESHAGLGRENVFPVLRKEDLAPGDAAALAARIVRRHF